ncbi:MAG: vanadium-dependent haloperoxidase [Bacteroidota bacterium]
MTNSSNSRSIHLLSLTALLLFTASSTAQVHIADFAPFKFQLEENFSPTDDTQRWQEIAEIEKLQKETNEKDIQAINYWNAAYPSYRWHQVMMKVSRAHKGHKNGGRVAVLHLAIYDALVEVWKYKKQYQEKAPFQLSPRVQQLSRDRGYSTFICEWSAAASAAKEVISYYFPDRKLYLDSLLNEFERARLRTGLQLPFDIKSGLAIGQQIASQYIEYAKTDRTDQIWAGQVPAADSLWSGNPGKWDPMKRQWKPLTLVSSDQFRPAPPPTDWTADMEELRQFNATHQTSEIAWKWKSAPVWDNLLERKILEYDLNPLKAAFASAVFHTARFDGIIAAWDGKYHYWGIRPFQYDSSFKPILIKTPNFPGYPAGHTTVAGSIATALSSLFPQDEQSFHALAKECSESRFEGGAHFRTDNEVGLTVGNQVGAQVVKTFLERMEGE